MAKVNRPWLINKPKHSRLVDNSKFYNSRKWRNVRANYLIKNPLCVYCEANDLTTPANVVDHIVPMVKGGDALCKSNLQSLCKSCHDKKSAKESTLTRGTGIIVCGSSRRTSHDKGLFTHKR